MDGPPPTQLRLGIDPPRRNVALSLRLEGLSTVAELTGGVSADARRYLHEAGIDARSHNKDGFAFPVAQLGSLAQLDPRCEVTAAAGLDELVRLARRGERSAATVDVDATGQLRLRFWDSEAMRDTLLDPVVAQALCCADLPFVASPAAWEHLEIHAAVPHTIGRARLGHDGYVEVWAARPQLVESLPVPGLFRLAPDRFGVAVPYAQQLSEVRGITWDGPVPKANTPDPTVMRNLGLPLAEPTRRLCARLVDRLGSWEAAVLVAGGGRARRTVVAAALEALEAWPALIVCPPSSLWAWWRTITLVGRELGVRRDDGADARAITWMDLAHGAQLDPVAAVVFDDLCGPDAGRAIADGALTRLGALSDAARVGVADTWPEDPEEGCRLAGSVRPGEFELGTHPLAWRYPINPGIRAAEHLRAWMVTPTDSEVIDEGVSGRFRTSQVRLATLDRSQRADLEALYGLTEPVALRRAIEVISAGSAGVTSAKIALALEEIQRGLNDGRGPIAVWVTSHRTAVRLRSLLAGERIKVCDPDDAEALLASAGADGVVVVCGPTPGRLRGAAVVIVDTLAVSFAALDDAVGGAHLDDGPHRVVVLHSPDSPDDRIATWAAGGGSLSEAAADPDRVRWLLSARWAPPPAPAATPRPVDPRPTAVFSSAPRIPGAGDR